MKAAKKKAEAVANSADMSEASKLKAVSKALRGQGGERAKRASLDEDENTRDESRDLAARHYG